MGARTTVVGVGMWGGQRSELDVVCLAHVTNTMAAHGDDFDKGSANGALAALAVTDSIARALNHM